MRIACAPSEFKFKGEKDTLNVVLYSRADRPTRGSAGAAIRKQIARGLLNPAEKAWDLLSLALSVIAADLAGHRTKSADGWTREFELQLAVVDPDFWNDQQQLINKLLGFLSTDVWNVSFVGGGFSPPLIKKPYYPPEECVSLLSGGLDSLIGNLDLAANGKRPFVVSQTVLGDAEKQRTFANAIAGGLRHLQMNHNAEVPNAETPSTQRARSLIFLTYGILAATMLSRYRAGGGVPLYICENGFISINPPLTDMRLGSLSTRTTHPVFLDLLRQLLIAAGLNVQLETPYRLKSKGEMLTQCANAELLKIHACSTTSCGRYLIHGHTHCGRCVPCLVRRAAFLYADIDDTTKYVFKKLGKRDADHAGFDDVRAVAMAVAAVKLDGLESWLGATLNTKLLGDVCPLEHVVSRGLQELGTLLKAHGVK